MLLNIGRRFFRRSSLLNRLETFIIPQPGEGIAEVEIQHWLIKPGESVKEFQVLCEARSDKGFIEYKSPYDGTITEHFYNANQMAPIGAPLFKIEIDDKKYPPKGNIKKEEDTETPKEEQLEESTSKTHSKVLATPAVRFLAKQKGIDISTIPSTGKDGRVLKEDLLRYLEGPSHVTPPVRPATVASVEAKDKVVKLSPIQKGMFKAMTEALAIPHLTYCEDIYMDTLIELRKMIKTSLTDVKLTFMPFFIKAMSLALYDFPIANSSFINNNTEFVMKSSHNVSFAMDSRAGLIVPNIKNCQNLSIYEIAVEMARLQELGSQGKINQADLEGGTICLSNIGTIGGTYTAPIIMTPQVLIGGLGAIRPRLERNKGEFVERQVLGSSWSADHRLLDGATVARFVARWKELLENPSLMLLHLK
ncbi:unnamed protein product [Blepharisma stoltei]|uniref:Dihydrolipoamide acetyltransferase component of pyruvate dehydrogenase complex n=1 Tax=Blepharisma stoltei TaxID=1481888 RepID=A0AAU9IV40_9CILI|nr:unnamed protein product [Blepharisma stoltei]